MLWKLFRRWLFQRTFQWFSKRLFGRLFWRPFLPNSLISDLLLVMMQLRIQFRIASDKQPEPSSKIDQMMRHIYASNGRKNLRSQKDPGRMMSDPLMLKASAKWLRRQFPKFVIQSECRLGGRWFSLVQRQPCELSKQRELKQSYSFILKIHIESDSILPFWIPAQYTSWGSIRKSLTSKNLKDSSKDDAVLLLCSSLNLTSFYCLIGHCFRR